MKRVITLILLITALSAMSQSADAIPPKWLRQIFGCTWQWSGNYQLVSTDGTTCNYSRPMYGSSWLWGDCGTSIRTWSQPCNENPMSGCPPLPSEDDYTMLAEEMNELKVSYPSIPESWTDADSLENDSIRNAAASYRLQLAGYQVLQSWFVLDEEPCPIPEPTLLVAEAQAYSYEPDVPCETPFLSVRETQFEDYISIFPNPSTGEFTITSSVKSLQKIEVLELNGTEVIFFKDILGHNREMIILDEYSPGIYIIRITTNDGVFHKKLVIE